MIDGFSAVPQLDEAAACAMVSSFAGKRVLVAGDVMLDEYLIGEVKRISPEAPVPVVDITHVAHVPGGAANVAANIASLGGVPLLVGLTGDDEGGARLRERLQTLGVDSTYLVPVRDRPTIVKTRIVSGQQQIARLDRESRTEVSGEAAARTEEAFANALKTADGCILSDYAKGLLSEAFCARAIEASKASCRPVVVDPKGTGFRKYAGCTVITPNLREAELASGLNAEREDALPQIFERLREIVGSEAALLVTRGAEGMTLFRHADLPLHVPALAHEVFDVTGAGDTVGGVIALALAAHIDLPSAMLLSNLAASVVVGKSGTATVSVEELQDACRGYSASALRSRPERSANRTYSSLPVRKPLPQ